MADNYVNQVEFLDADGEVTSTHDIQDSDNAELARIDGSYEDMTVGQLVSKVEVVDKVPYLFRTSGGSADIGNREYDEIVGGSVVWNQLVKNGNFESLSNWSVFASSKSSISVLQNELIQTLSGDSKTSPFQYGLQQSNVFSNPAHKYLFSCEVTPSFSTNFRVEIGGSSRIVTDTFSANTKSIISGVAEAASYNKGIMIYPLSGVDGVDTSGLTIKYKNVQLFDLTAMFDQTIANYTYNLNQTTAGAGVAKLKEWGFFGKDYYEYDPGTFKHVEGLISHKTVGFNAFNVETGVAKVVGGDLYQITGAYTSISIDGTAITPDAQGLFTPPADGTLTVVGGDATTTCVHLVWSGYKNGEYEPYREHVYPLDSSLTLRGIAKQDENGELYYDGDIYRADGTVERRYGERAYQSGDENDSAVRTDGTTTVYLLSTPTTEQAEPYQEVQIVDDFGTEEYVTNSIIPVGHTTRYPANLRDKLQRLPDSAGADGDYIVRQSGSQMALVPITEVKELPDTPTANGTYRLTATVADGTPTFAWVSA